MDDAYIAQVDGHTFLSREELDAYYEQQANQEYEQRGEDG